MASTKRVSLGHRHEGQNWPKLVGCSWTILPEELVAEILLRLPVSCLVKLKSVCRSWRALISSSQFAKSHLQRSIPIRYFAYTFLLAPKTEDRRIGIFSAESPFHNPITKVISFSVGTGLVSFNIIGSANGLLCLLHSERGSCRAKLWNPCIRMESEWLNIDADLSKKGFGYDHVHNQYKLFGEFSESGSMFSSRICTLGEDSNSWRTIEDHPKLTVENKATFVPGTGALNWVSYDGAVIVCLDLAKESYGEFSVPHHENERGSRYRPMLSVLKNCLALCYEHKKTHWAVWLMKEYGKVESWTLVAMIPRDDRLHNYLSSRSLIPMYLLLTEEGDGEQDLLLARGLSTKIVSCNLNDASLNFPVFDSTSDGVLDYPLNQGSNVRCFQIFHQSLVSPSHFGLPSSLSSMSLIE